jgi:hypothetical protein
MGSGKAAGEAVIIAKIAGRPEILVSPGRTTLLVISDRTTLLVNSDRIPLLASPRDYLR